MRTHSDTTRANILAAATRLFLRHGYGAATVDSIAISAQVTKRTVYGYFPDKRSIFIGTLERLTGNPYEFDIPLELVTSTEGLHHALQTIARSMNEVASQTEYVELLRVVIAELPSQPELEVLFRRGITRRSLRLLDHVLETARAHGLIHCPYPELVARQFVGGFLAPVFVDGLLVAGEADIGKLNDAQLTEYVNSFMYYLTQPSPTAA